MSQQSIKGIEGCKLLSYVHPISIMGSHASSNRYDKTVDNESLYEQTKRLYKDTHKTNLQKFMDKVKELQDKGAFGLHGDNDMVQRYDAIKNGKSIIDLSNSSTVDALIDAMLPALADRTCRIEYLNLAKTRITIDGIISLANGLKNNKSLKTLIIIKTPIKIDSLQDKLGKNKKLNFPKYGYRGYDIAFIGTYLHKNKNSKFYSIDFSSNVLCGDKGTFLRGLQIFSSYLMDNDELSFLKLQNTGIKSDGVLKIVPIIHKVQKLQSLDLSYNDLVLDWKKKKDEQGLHSLCSMITKTYNLMELNLSKCRLDYSSALIIGEMLMLNDTLRKLKLSNNPIGCAGICSIADGLSKNNGLKRIELKNICIRTNGCKKFITKLKKFNKGLCEIDLSKNMDIKKDGMNVIVDYLHDNPNIIEFRSPHDSKYLEHQNLIQDICRANQDISLIRTNLNQFDFKHLKEFSLTNFFKKINWLNIEELEILMQKNLSFHEIKISKNHFTILRYYSSTGIKKIMSNINQLLYVNERKKHFEDILRQYEKFLDKENLELWLQDL